MKWSYLILAFLTMLILGLADNMRGPVFPDVLKEFSLSDSMGSLFFIVASAAGLVANLASSFWLKKWGPVFGIKLFQISISVGLILLSFSAGHFWILLLAMVFIGLSFGGTGITQNILIAWGASPKMRRRAYSTLHAIYGFASLASPLVIIVFYDYGLHWQKAFFVVGMLSVLVNLWSMTVKKHSDDPPFPETSFGKLQISKRKLVWFAMFNSFYVVAELLIGTRLVLLARREWGLSTIASDQILGLFYALFLAGRLIMSSFHFQFRTRNLMLWSLSLTIGLFVLGIFTHPVVIALCGLSMSIFYPCAIAYVYEEAETPVPDGIVAWTMTFNSAAVLLMHLSVGYISDIFGLKVAIWIGPLALFAALGLLLWPNRPTKGLKTLLN